MVLLELRLYQFFCNELPFFFQTELAKSEAAEGHNLGKLFIFKEMLI